MPINEWFSDFFTIHQGRFHLYPWPESDSSDYERLIDDWESAFDDVGMTEVVAFLASKRLAREKVRWDEHLPRLLAIAAEIERATPRTPEAGPSTREEAEAMSRHCPDCSGSGITFRYRHRPGPTDAREHAPGFRQSCYCLCHAGRWIYSRHKATAPDMIARYIDLADPKLSKLKLRTIGDGTLDNPHRYPPGSWDAEADIPKVAALAPTS